MKQYKLLSKETVFEEFIEVEKLKLEKEGKKITRYLVRRPDAASGLLLNKTTNSFIFASQFRPSAFVNNENPDLLEIPAGGIEKGEKPISSAKREILEETGYSCNELKLIHQFYPSPGFVGERIYVYYGEVTKENKIKKGGGIEEESENITVTEVSVKKVRKMLNNNEIHDAKTLVALNWWFANFKNSENL